MTRPLLVLLLVAAACGGPAAAGPAPPASPVVRRVVDGALGQIGVTTGYDPAYVRIPYPNGDVPANTGVCSDVVIRAFRAAGVDLQRAVHQDMRLAFRAYPNRWGLSRPDSNIDHRRVPNLMCFFRRAGREVPIGDDPSRYVPGDVVAWDLGDGLGHIGVVSDRVAEATGRPMVVHNIGRGVQLEDVLFEWAVIGHYRYFE